MYSFLPTADEEVYHGRLQAPGKKGQRLPPEARGTQTKALLSMLTTCCCCQLSCLSPLGEAQEESCEAPHCTVDFSQLQRVKWVRCDHCTRWFHLHCVGLTTVDSDDWFVLSACSVQA